MTDRLYEAGLIVSHLSRALVDGTRDLGVIPGLVRRIIKEELWREYSDLKSGRRFGPFNSFPEFVETPGSDGGLGLTRKQLEGLCTDQGIRTLIAEAYKRPHGGDRRSSDFKPDIIRLEPYGTSQSYILRRLHENRPDLYEKVISGEMKANAAAQEAGWRKKVQSVRMDDPDSAARTIRKFMTEEARRHLATLLLE